MNDPWTAECSSNIESAHFFSHDNYTFEIESFFQPFKLLVFFQCKLATMNIVVDLFINDIGF